MVASYHKMHRHQVFIFFTAISSLLHKNVHCLVPPSPSKRVALVTGANKGIGKEIARKLAALEEGETTVILACRNPQLGKATTNELAAEKASTANVQFRELDLTKKDTIDATTKYIDETFGKLDILINNAAICFNDPTLYGKVPHTPFQKQADITIQTNFFGTLYVTQKMLPLLEQSSAPRIVNVASSAGRLSILKSKEKINQFTSTDLTMNELEKLMSQFVKDVENNTHEQNGWPNACYGMSKLGIIAMTKILSREYYPHTKKMCINSADPGFCATDQNNNQGYVSAERGAVTPFLLATLPEVAAAADDDDDAERIISGRHFFEEKEIPWSYGQL